MFARRRGLRSAPRFSLGATVFAWRLGFRSAPRFSLGATVFARRRSFRSAPRFSLGAAVFARRRGFRSAPRFSLGGAIFSQQPGYISASSSLYRSPLQQPGPTTPFLRSLPAPETANEFHRTTFFFSYGRSPGYKIVSPFFFFIPFSAPASAPWRLLVECRFHVLALCLPSPPPPSPSLGSQASSAVVLWVSFCFLVCSVSLEVVAARSLNDYSFSFFKEILSLGRHCPNIVLFLLFHTGRTIGVFSCYIATDHRILLARLILATTSNLSAPPDMHGLSIFPTAIAMESLHMVDWLNQEKAGNE